MPLGARAHVSYCTRVKIGSGVSLSLSVVQFRVPGQACGQGVAGVAGVPLFLSLKTVLGVRAGGRQSGQGVWKGGLGGLFLGAVRRFVPYMYMYM